MLRTTTRTHPEQGTYELRKSEAVLAKSISYFTLSNIQLFIFRKGCLLTFKNLIQEDDIKISRNFEYNIYRSANIPRSYSLYFLPCGSIFILIS